MDCAMLFPGQGSQYVGMGRDYYDSCEVVRETYDAAISLGATIVYREAEDVARALLDFAREEKVKVLVLGRPTRTGITGRIAPGIVSRVLEGARGLDVFVVDVDREAGA